MEAEQRGAARAWLGAQGLRGQAKAPALTHTGRGCLSAGSEGAS